MAVRILLTFIIVFCVLSILPYYTADSYQQVSKCKSVKGKSSCVCKTKNGKYIDLRSLGNEDRTNPKFVTSYDNFVYFVNPCYGVALDTLSGACSAEDGMVGCQQRYDDNADNDEDEVFGIGRLDTETIYEFPNGTASYVRYTNGQPEENDEYRYRSTKILLYCDEYIRRDIFTVAEEGGGGGGGAGRLQSVFYLRSNAVCPRNSIPGLGGSIVGPIGLGIIAFAIAAMIAYCIIGSLVNKFAFDKTGSEIIPQKDFWFSLPTLVKDGALFLCSILLCRKPNEYLEFD